MHRTTTPHHPRRGMRRLALAAAVVSVGALALPAAGQAATTFGSPLTETPQSGVNPNATQCLNPPQPVPCTRVLIALNKFNANFPITSATCSRSPAASSSEGSFPERRIT